MELLLNTIVSGLLVGGLYAAVGVGFGMALGFVGVANLAHPTFVVVGAYGALAGWRLGVDPILAGLLWMPVFYAVGYALHGFYERVFERQGGSSLNGMTFFFGLMFVLEVLLTMGFGVDFQMVSTGYGSQVIRWGGIDLPMRLLLPFLIGGAMILGLTFWMRATFTGQAIAAVAQDATALQIIGADPQKIRRIAFAIGLATAALAGALLLVTVPIQPSSGREFIGRMFAVVVLGGLTSLRGTLVAALLLGVAEGMVQTYAGAAWAAAVGFGILFLALAVRPEGLFRR